MTPSSEGELKGVVFRAGIPQREALHRVNPMGDGVGWVDVTISQPTRTSI